MKLSSSTTVPLLPLWLLLGLTTADSPPLTEEQARHRNGTLSFGVVCETGVPLMD